MKSPPAGRLSPILHAGRQNNNNKMKEKPKTNKKANKPIDFSHSHLEAAEVA